MLKKSLNQRKPKIAKKKDGRGRHGNHLKGERVKRTPCLCPICAKIFYKLPSFLKQHPKTKYCSAKCAAAGLSILLHSKQY